MIDQLEYNAERPHLIIPEYGRHLQKMVNQCIAIEDREEQNKCAKSIIAVMGTQPHLRDVPISAQSFGTNCLLFPTSKLDVEAPYPKPSRKNWQNAPSL